MYGCLVRPSEDIKMATKIAPISLCSLTDVSNSTFAISRFIKEI